MSLDKKQYFTENLIETLSKPLIVGGLIVGFNFYENRNKYNNKIDYSKGFLGAGACLGARFLISKIPITSNEGIKSVQHMVMEPALTSGMYIVGRRMVDDSKDYMRDAVISASSSVAAGYLVSPIDRFFD